MPITRAQASGTTLSRGPTEPLCFGAGGRVKPRTRSWSQARASGRTSSCQADLRRRCARPPAAWGAPPRSAAGAALARGSGHACPRTPRAHRHLGRVEVAEERLRHGPSLSNPIAVINERASSRQDAPKPSGSRAFHVVAGGGGAIQVSERSRRPGSSHSGSTPGSHPEAFRSIAPPRPTAVKRTSYCTRPHRPSRDGSRSAPTGPTAAKQPS
jgi:hypothetical protein